MPCGKFNGTQPESGMVVSQPCGGGLSRITYTGHFDTDVGKQGDRVDKSVASHATGIMGRTYIPTFQHQCDLLTPKIK